MAPRAINEYLLYRLKEADQEMLFQMTLGQWVLSTGKGKHNYLDRINEIWGVRNIETKDSKKRGPKPYRPAKEIIADTFSRMKIKIKDKNEDVTDGCV